MPAEISCQRVRKVFGKGTAAFEAVTAATFAIEKGEFVCLLGAFSQAARR
jgi:ABC-type Fe3+/spermidine/putrescine transport system ATPase subunit